MIPPVVLVPGQTVEQQNMVGWKNTFNMRQVTLMNLAASYSGGRNGSVSHFISRGCITSPAKSLDLLRRNLQNSINRDIDNVIKKYLEKYFQPAINNIKMNQGKNSVSEELIQTVCQQMLEDAKLMYTVTLQSASSRDSSPYTYSDSEMGSTVESRLEQTSPIQCKRKESDTDSDTSCITSLKHHKLIKISSETLPYKLPEKREGRKWDPDRITPSTLFIMGAKANKVLGFGQTRGRLYVRHPHALRYPSDSEDKEWLASHNLMPPSGGKAYLMLVEDVQELAMSDDYRNNPNLQLQELCGFEAPPFIISKIKTFMENARTDKKPVATTSLFDYHPGQTTFTPIVCPPDTSHSTTFTLLETTGTTTLQDANIIHNSVADNSFIPEHYNQVTLCSSSNIEQEVMSINLSQNMESSSQTESSVSNIERYKKCRILDHLISTHGTTDSS